jgi:hypothetical protein
MCGKKYVFFSGYVSFSRTKFRRYFHFNYPLTQYTYADANVQCCKYGLKLAVLETAEEVACVNIATCKCALIYFKVGWNFKCTPLLVSTVQNGNYVWVGASQSSTGEVQWCQSNVPVSDSGLYINTDPDPLIQRYAIVLAKNGLYSFLDSSKTFVLCN